MSRKHKKRKKHGFSGNPGSSKERLLKRITSSGLWTDVGVETRPSGTEKMSEVILRFAAPLLNNAPDDSSYEFGLQFSILVWNLSFLPPQEQADQTRQLIGEVAKDDPQETKAVIDMLLHRKAAYFSKHRRAIVDYTLSYSGDDRHLTVASTKVRL